MTKWEYRLVAESDMVTGRQQSEPMPVEQALAALGSQGWEHYWVSPTSVHYFKRPIVTVTAPAAPAPAPQRAKAR